MVRCDGRVCRTGFLSGLAPITSFNPLLQMPSRVQFSFFGSFVFGTPEFPLAEIPLQAPVDRMASGAYRQSRHRCFDLKRFRRPIE
jgi:hypothetical protein